MVAYLLPDPEHSTAARELLVLGYIVAAFCWLWAGRRASSEPAGSFSGWWLWPPTSHTHSRSDTALCHPRNGVSLLIPIEDSVGSAVEVVGEPSVLHGLRQLPGGGPIRPAQGLGERQCRQASFPLEFRIAQIGSDSFRRSLVRHRRERGEHKLLFLVAGGYLHRSQRGIHSGGSRFFIGGFHQPGDGLNSEHAVDALNVGIEGNH